MPKVVVCAKCGMRMGLPDNAAGQLIQCPSCKAVYTLPASAPAALPTMPAPPGYARVVTLRVGRIGTLTISNFADRHHLQGRMCGARRSSGASETLSPRSQKEVGG